MEGFIRTVYDNGYKYTMVYPPGWKSGDPRIPLVYKELCIPRPSDSRIVGSSSFGARSYPERPNLADRQPHNAATAPRQPTGDRNATDLDPATEVQHTEQTLRSYPLKMYLAQIWLPKYVISSQVDLSAKREWPFFLDLVRVAHARKLYFVQRISDLDLLHAFALLKEALSDVPITSVLVEQGKVADLTLPDTVCCVLNENDLHFLDSCRLYSPSDVTKLLQAYPLRTVIKVIKLFLGILDDEVCATLTFNDVNHLCPVKHFEYFDLIAMPGSQPNDLSLLMVVLRPWDFKNADFEEFARAGVPDSDLNSIHGRTPFPLPSDTLWAVIWDLCLEHKCRFFVLTNYDEWVFGTLSPDMHRAGVTTHLRAPVFPGAMSVAARDVAQPCFPSTSVIESLLLWILAAQDDNHIWWPQPPNMPNPIDPRKPSILDGRWGDPEMRPQL